MPPMRLKYIYRVTIFLAFEFSLKHQVDLENKSTWKFVPKSVDQFAIPNTPNPYGSRLSLFWRRKTKSKYVLYN